MRWALNKTVIGKDIFYSIFGSCVPLQPVSFKSGFTCKTYVRYVSGDTGDKCYGLWRQLTGSLCSRFSGHVISMNYDCPRLAHLISHPCVKCKMCVKNTLDGVERRYGFYKQRVSVWVFFSLSLYIIAYATNCEGSLPNWPLLENIFGWVGHCALPGSATTALT